MLKEHKSGKTSLIISLEKQQFAIAGLFIIKFHADVNIKTYSEHTPLHYACLYNNVEMVKLLIGNGCQVGNKTLERKTEKDLTTDEKVCKLIQLEVFNKLKPGIPQPIQWTLSITNSQGTKEFVRDRESS